MNKKSQFLFHPARMLIITLLQIVFSCLVTISVALPRGADFTDEEINQNKNAR